MRAATAPGRTGGGAPTLPRTLAVWCPDWSARAAASAVGIRDDRPVAVLVAGRVVAANDTARTRGIRRGQRKREAQYRCPEVALLARDLTVEARLFEPVVVALETVAAGVEISRPGLALINARGPSRYYGGEDTAVAAVARTVAAGAVVGIADGAFAAALAARTGVIVPPGGSPRFLEPLPITTFGTAQESPLVDVLIRLGIRTLGDFAALPTGDVIARFGAVGAWTQRLASGRDDRPIAARRPPVDCTVRVDFDAPVDRSDTVAFSVRTAAERFVAGLVGHGHACVCVEITAELETGEQVSRRWRHTAPFTAVAVVDRVRWQLDGVFAAGPTTGPAADLAGRAGCRAGAVIAVTLTPIETVPPTAHQLTLWGGPGERNERVEAGIARIQSRYGHTSVTRLVAEGGTGPAARTGRVPWGEAAVPGTSPDRPWPGHLPAPAPTIVPDEPRPIRVLDARGRVVTFTDRAAVSAPPATIDLDGRRGLPVTTWAGPWPDTEQWWNPDAAPQSRRLRCQLVDVHGRAYLATCRAGTDDPDWLLEGVYD